uniref:CID domain-containing protein n=1 Tax=Ascaris lumbricoides TaxID=6252 RepID=A0A0M3HFB1_ASCLU
MASPTLDDIYDACGRLDEASGEKKADDYALFIDGAKSIDAKVKKLSAQMIVRYWKNFTEQRNLAFYSLVSILEDRDPEGTIVSACRFGEITQMPGDRAKELQTRKAVIRELSQLVKTGQLVDKFADVLSQMLQQTDDAQEMSMLTNTLAQFLKSYPKGVPLCIMDDLEYRPGSAL